MRGIRTKLILWVSILFIFIGLLIYVPLSIILPRKITSQILKRDVKIAEHIADKAKEHLLLNDATALSLLLYENLKKLEDAQYLFISGPSGNIVSHTFKQGFPKALLPLNNGVRRSYVIKELLSKGKRIYCISVPILKGELGALHLGVSLDSSKTEIAEFAKINYYVAVIIFIGLGIGILIFSVLGLFLSQRIIKLKDFAAKVGAGDLNDRININTKDEIGSLAASFNEMVEHLKEKIETIKNLSYMEERDRIAIEFHDGLAQDLTSVIKRLELCERLFKIDPEGAFKELNNLKENTKDILNRTRQLIFNLKSPQDEEFNLVTSLSSYIKNYQIQNNINVSLKTSGAMDWLPPDKIKPVFFIIKEALANVRKHSFAKNVEAVLGLTDNNELSVNIRDDGHGFDVEKTELFSLRGGRCGLKGMRQRAHSLGGELDIDSSPGEGTNVKLVVPLISS